MSIGRNGSAQTTGIQARGNRRGNVDLIPVTSRSAPQNACIEISAAAMDELCWQWLCHRRRPQETGETSPELDALDLLLVDWLNALMDAGGVVSLAEPLPGRLGPFIVVSPDGEIVGHLNHRPELMAALLAREEYGR